MDALLQYLNSIYPLSKDLEDYLSEVLKQKELAKKEYLLKAGHVSQYIYFIEKGLLRCFYIKHNIEISSWFMKEGDVVISVKSFFKQKPSYESIQALEDCTLYYISYNELQYIYHHYKDFNFIGRTLTENYYALSEDRLASIRLLRGQERYDEFKEQYPDLVMRVPAKYLASYLGITEVHLSNIKARR